MGADDTPNQSDSSTWDFGADETQEFDSQQCESPTSSFGHRGDAAELATQVMDHDELATQVMDPDGETEPLYHCGETQVVNVEDEIEVMDMFDDVEGNETQLLDGYDTEEVVSDHEGTEKTEIVDDSDDDFGMGDCADSADVQHTEKLHQCKENNTSGTGFRTFTSIRAASMRAAGLTALNKAPKTSKDAMEHRRIQFEKSQPHDVEKLNQLTVGQEAGNTCGFGRPIARKLFDEDTVSETKDETDKIDLDGGAKSPVLDTELAGLSYLDSQEPGDASQANALDFVDNFLKVNIDCDDDFGVRKSTGGKSKPVLTAKGAQTFAKSASIIDEFDKRVSFCWDNNLEDGGGEFYRKKKEVFFASGNQKVKSSVPSRSCRKLVSGKNKESGKSKKSLGTVIKDLTFRKSLIKDLDNQSTDMPIMPGGTDIQGTIQETTEVRFDTQMAAEAMEELCFGMQEIAQTSQPIPMSKEGVRTRRSKSKMSGDHSKKVKRAKSAAKKSENLDNIASDVAKRTRKMSQKRIELELVDAPVASVEQMPVKKQRVQNITPAPRTRRTRQSIKIDEPNKEINFLTGFHPKGKRTRKEVGTQSLSRLTRSKAATLTEQEKGSIKERFEQNLSLCMTPVNRATPLKESSPICMGDEYLKQSCRRPSLIKEVNGLFPTDSSFISPNKDTRQRRDVTLIRVLFSRHLDADIIKQQKKILSRLGASESSSMSDATHFIADSFARTRNMLEAIALGKPVVTHLWLESCGQACCHIDEKRFILRDAKKEKKFGFSIPSSLARASQHPLLKGHGVMITPNTKPGKEILSSLVKAVHGVVVERMGRNLLNDDKALEGLLILSCEEDYAVCLPFLEKGTTIYSSELLLNGILTQRLEYERHRLFLDHVKRTRSTIWLKEDDNRYKPVGKVK
ncbi:uncharacterized protein LOC143594635 [Bidens hawaiensis]|uniref:uncharacterized protein LOC143594635 n=1 Tax=Bidens hawaiensis TaxID=980011 RepID=UPI004048F003